MSGMNGHAVRSQPITKAEASHWFESLRMQIMASVAEGNRTHVLTAFRVMAWEELALKRPWGLARTLLTALFRPARLMRMVAEKQTEIMRQQMEEARSQMARASLGGDGGKAHA